MSEAKKYYGLSKDIFESTNHKIGLGSVMLATGNIADLEGDHLGALKIWRQARQIFASNGLDLYTKKAEEKINANQSH